MKDPLRIAMVAACPYPARRGTPIRIQRMAEALVQRGHEVHVLTYHFGDSVPEEPPFIHRISPDPHYSVMAPGPTYRKILLLDPRLGRLLVSTLRRLPIDIVHAHHYEGLLTASIACRITGHPFVYDAHTILESELPSYPLGLPYWIKKRAGRILDRRLPGLASHVIVVSETLREKLISHKTVAPGGVSLVESGVENEWVLGSDNEPVRPSGEPVITFTGNLASYQRVDLLLRAFRRVSEKRSDASLLVVTESNFAECEEMVENEGLTGKVVFIHADPVETRHYLANASILVNPRTECDGMPQKLLNYMGAGRPIVSFAGSSGILEDGRTGVVVENDDVEKFGEAILDLLDRPEFAHRLGRNARRMIVEGLSWEKTAEDVEAVYRRVLRGRERS